MKVHVNIRGDSQQGSFVIQQQIEAPSLLEALDIALTLWGIERSDLTRVHLAPPTPEEQAAFDKAAITRGVFR